MLVSLWFDSLSSLVPRSARECLAVGLMPSLGGTVRRPAGLPVNDHSLGGSHHAEGRALNPGLRRIDHEHGSTPAARNPYSDFLVSFYFDFSGSRARPGNTSPPVSCPALESRKITGT